MRKILEWLKSKEERRYERYSYLLISFVGSYCLFYLTQKNDCKRCLDCNVVNSRIEKLQLKINQANSEAIAFKQLNLNDSVINRNSNVINFSIRQEEIKNIIDLLNQE